MDLCKEVKAKKEFLSFQINHVEEVLRWIVKTFHNHKRIAEQPSKRELHAASPAEEDKLHDAVLNYEELSGVRFEQEIDKICSPDVEFEILQNAECDRIIFYDSLRLKLLSNLYFSHQYLFSQPGIEELCELCISCKQYCNNVDCIVSALHKEGH